MLLIASLLMTSVVFCDIVGRTLKPDECLLSSAANQRQGKMQQANFTTSVFQMVRLGNT